MMKFIIVLFITALITVSFGTVIKKQKGDSQKELISPVVAGTSNTTNPSISGWPVFVNNYYGYKIKHPSELSIKNQRNGDVSLVIEKSVNIFITQDTLSENETINTIIEKNIDKKKAELGEKFRLIYPISPIALGLETAQTYTSEENGQRTTYYYVPQKNGKFLLITNYSPSDGETDYLVSEDIIYSLEFFP